MSDQFYDLSFNHAIDFEDSWMPEISAYLISPDAYSSLVPQKMTIAASEIYSKASGTNNLNGAMSMARGLIPLHSGDFMGMEIITPDPEHDPDLQTLKVTVYNSSKTEIESINIPDIGTEYSNISLVGYCDSNDQLVWASIGYTFPDGSVCVNGSGFSATVINLLAPYVYLRYKYEYQVVIQKALRGTDGFEISRFPADWLNKKLYGTGAGQSTKYNEVVFRLDPDHPDVWTDSVAWWRSPPLSTLPSWLYNYNANQLALAMGVYAEEKGIAFGSDITRLLPDGKFYNGLDLDNTNLAWTDTSGNQDPYEIEFSGGKLKLCFVGLYRYIQLLDNEDNVVDQWQLPYPVSGGGSAIPTGEAGWNLGNNGGIGALYLAQNGTKYYLVALYGQTSYYDDDGNQIVLSDSYYGTYYGGIAFRKVYEFSNEGNTILFKATEDEKIVPADPDSLTEEQTSNQTTDPQYKTEEGEYIPIPDYSEGDWGDGTSDGIRGSGNGRTTGGNSEGRLDQQPDLPGAPSIPTAVSTGFMKLYNPTDAEIQALCAELTQDSFLDDLRKYFGNNPLDFIVGLQVVPGAFSVDNQKYTIKYGSYQSQVGMCPITDEFTELDFGTLQLGEIYGNWEDYNPHTKMSIYLPYIGIKDLDPDRIQGTLLSLKYHIDAVTGSIVARLTSTRKDNKNRNAEYLVGQWAGQAAYTIPLTNVQHNAAVNAVIGVVSAAVSVGAAVATSGTSVAAQAATAAAVGTSIGNAALSGAHAGKTDITMQGSVSGSLAFFTGHDAYIQIEYPLDGRPDDYDHIIGKPSNITTDLNHQPAGSYIEFINVDVSGVNAPQEEKAAIVEMLKGGVYK